jgi:hypothetical protein
MMFDFVLGLGLYVGSVVLAVIAALTITSRAKWKRVAPDRFIDRAWKR